MFYSKSTTGFYSQEIHGDNIPADAVEITNEYHQELLTGQSIGKIISTDENGYPVLINPPKLEFSQLQASALVSIDDYHALQVQALVGNPTQTEKDTWNLKLEIANAIVSGSKINESGHAFLTASGKLTDDDKQLWAASVLNKAKKYAEYVGLAEKLRDNARAAVKAATTEDELNAAIEEHRKIAEDAVAELGGS